MSERLKRYLASRGSSIELQQLTADASTREYFRIEWNDGTAIACVYPDPYTAAVNSYDDVTGLFLAADLPVAKLFDVDASRGIVVQEDLGDRILRDRLQTASAEDRERSIDHAIKLIARTQAATELAFERRSLASRLRFDTQKLTWELNYFKEHYFGTFRRRPLSRIDDVELTSEFIELCSELEECAGVLCHRDFHAANLMLDAADQLRVIDHQDARMGSPTYDLVSLLLDRVTEAPSAPYLSSKCRFFLSERERIGMPAIDQGEFGREFTLQTIQRCLKAAGTFSYQSTVRGKTYFIQYIEPMLDIAAAAAATLDRFPAIRELGYTR